MCSCVGWRAQGHAHKHAHAQGHVQVQKKHKWLDTLLSTKTSVDEKPFWMEKNKIGVLIAMRLEQKSSTNATGIKNEQTLYL